MKRLLRLSLALFGSLSLVLLATTPMVYAAGPFTCTWTGLAYNDNNMSNSANWTDCNGSSPQPNDNDNLVFPFDLINGNPRDNTPYNDITNASFGNITVSGVSDSPNYYVIDGNPFTLTGDISETATGVSSHGLEIMNDITLNSNQTISTSDTAGIQITGAISGSGNIHVSGNLLLAGDNPSYTGQITVDTGMLIASQTNSLGDNNAPGAIINDGADFVLESCNIRWPRITDFNGNLTLNGSSRNTGGDFPEPKFFSSGGDCMRLPGTPFFAAYGSSYVSNNINFTGTITLGSDITFGGNTPTTTVTGSIVGNHAISMMPGYIGKLVLAGSSNGSSIANGTYSSSIRNMTISSNDPANDIYVTGKNVTAIDGTTGDVNVYGGGVLMGSGSAGTITVDTASTVAPGHSPGCLTSTGLIINGTFLAELGGTAACSGYDQLVVNGAVDVTNGTLVPTLYNGFVPSVGQSYTIINNDGSDAVTGTFSGIAQGGTVTTTGVTYSVSYTGGDGNDVVMTVVAVNASQLPTGPNTGFVMLTTNPLFTLSATMTLAAGLYIASRRLRALKS